MGTLACLSSLEVVMRARARRMYELTKRTGEARRVVLVKKQQVHRMSKSFLQAEGKLVCGVEKRLLGQDCAREVG